MYALRLQLDAAQCSRCTALGRPGGRFVQVYGFGERVAKPLRCTELGKLGVHQDRCTDLGVEKVQGFGEELLVAEVPASHQRC